MDLHTNPDGLLRFAAISHTALGTRTARLDDLAWFYRELPRRGVHYVIHLGGVTDTADPDLPKIYPHVEGITTLERQDGRYAACAGRMIAAGRDDWLSCPPSLPVVYGPPAPAESISTRPGTTLFLRYDWSGDKPLKAIVEALPPIEASQIVLIGGQRQAHCRYFNKNRSFIASIGAFNARISRSKPPLPFGGAIIEAQLRPDGLLERCTLTFRDMSGGMADARHARLAGD